MKRLIIQWIGPCLSALAALVLLVAAARSESNWQQFWLCVGFGGFSVETWALARQARGDTLSETVWAETQPVTRRVVLGIFMLWLTLHFVFRLG